MAIKLYVIPASHPSAAAELMLQRKGLPYKRRDLITAMHIPIIKALGFPGRTVPAINSDGRKVQGTRDISRFLDELKPEPPLFPADPEKRRQVEEAERWGDEQLQSVPRRLAWFAFGRDHSTVKDFLRGYKLGLPTSVAAATAGPIIWAEQKVNKATADACRADVQRLPELLDHVDELIAKGVIGGDEPNAADYQIGTSVRLLMAFDQLQPLLAGRPAAAFAEKIAPDPGGRVPSALPAEWIPALSPSRGAPS
jgi:glutathione S-transferase